MVTFGLNYLYFLGLTWICLVSLVFRWFYLQSLVPCSHMDSFHLMSCHLTSNGCKSAVAYHTKQKLSQQTAPADRQDDLGWGPAGRLAKTINKSTETHQDPPRASITHSGGITEGLQAGTTILNFILFGTCNRSQGGHAHAHRGEDSPSFSPALRTTSTHGGTCSFTSHARTKQNNSHVGFRSMQTPDEPFKCQHL